MLLVAVVDRFPLCRLSVFGQTTTGLEITEKLLARHTLVRAV